MTDFKQRLFNEKNELETKYLKLDEFLSSTKALELPQIQLNLLYLQNDIMAAYLRILKTRIELLINVG